MKAAIYTRVSHKLQADKGTSIDMQMSQLQAYAIAKGMKVVGVYEDPAFTGRNFNRPGYKKMVSEAQVLGVKAVLVYSLSRFGRNTIGVLEQVKELQDSGISFHALDIGIDTSTPTGTVFLTIVAALAQLESDQISKRIRDVQTNRKQTHSTYCGNPPLGYRNVDKQLIPVEQEMQLVKEIFDMYARLGSYSAVASDLNHRQIVGKNGGVFQSSTIKKIINNSIYENTRDIPNPGC
jgi:site-specific DNA recombinase